MVTMTGDTNSNTIYANNTSQIADAIVKCVCQETCNLFKVGKHCDTKHSGMPMRFKGITICGHNDEGVEVWTPWLERRGTRRVRFGLGLGARLTRLGGEEK